MDNIADSSKHSDSSQPVGNQVDKLREFTELSDYHDASTDPDIHDDYEDSVIADNKGDEDE